MQKKLKLVGILCFQLIRFNPIGREQVCEGRSGFVQKDGFQLIRFNPIGRANTCKQTMVYHIKRFQLIRFNPIGRGNVHTVKPTLDRVSN